MDRVSKASRPVAILLLMGLIALPAGAALPAAADAVGGAVARNQAVSQVGMRDAAMPGAERTYRWDKTGNARPATALLPDERTSPRQTMVWIAQVSLIIGLAGLGLTITSTSLIRDMKRRRRVVYRPRGR